MCTNNARWAGKKARLAKNNERRIIMNENPTNAIDLLTINRRA